jgi:hypothetical protein
MAQNRDDIIRRVKALMEKTVAAGCSEAEAMAASEAATRLMNKYELELTDIKIAEQANCQEFDINVGYKTTPPSFMTAGAIAYLTDTRAWTRKDRAGFPHLVFFGFETDVIVAQYIFAIIERSMLHAWMAYKIEADYKGASTVRRRALQEGFDAGMAGRIDTRLRRMKDEQRRENSASGRDLVVLKRPIVDAELAKLGIHFTAHRAGRARPMNGAAYEAGQRAGDNVAFNKGVGASTQGRLG